MHEVLTTANIKNIATKIIFSNKPVKNDYLHNEKISHKMLTLLYHYSLVTI